jgi:hypothetical protein
MTDKEILDADFCLRKADEFRGKAKGTDDSKLKSAFEAAAREYEMRAKALKTKPSQTEH